MPNMFHLKKYPTNQVRKNSRKYYTCTMCNIIRFKKIHKNITKSFKVNFSMFMINKIRVKFNISLGKKWWYFRYIEFCM